MNLAEKRYIFVVLIRHLIKHDFLSADHGVKLIERYHESNEAIEDALLDYEQDKDITLLIMVLQSLLFKDA